MSKYAMDDVLACLENVTDMGGYYRAHCPSHDDNEPSFNIRSGPDGTPQYKCHAGCTWHEVTQAMMDRGLEIRGNVVVNERMGSRPTVIKTPSAPKKNKPHSSLFAPVDEYNYQNDDGTVAYRIIRSECVFEGERHKRIHLERTRAQEFTEDGRKKPTQRILYRIPEVKAARSGDTIYFVEGEKDVHRLESLGLLATTCGGVSSWTKDMANYFTNKRLVILPDNDVPGHKLAARVAEDCAFIAKSIKIVELPGLTDKEDVSDYLDYGKTLDDLMSVIDETSLKDSCVPTEIEWKLVRSGKPIANVENLVCLLDAYNITVTFDNLTKHLNFDIPNEELTLDNNIAYIMSLAETHGYPTKHVPDYIRLVAQHYETNPVKDWILSKEWDGTDRISPLIQSLDAMNADIAGTLVFRWLLGAVAAAFEKDGAPQAGVLLLQGPQYIGKTSWFWSLLGNNTNFGFDSFDLDVKDKDSISQFCKYWLVEFGEFDAAIRKNDAAKLKAFITRSVDEFRRPYARAESTYPRRTAMIGTINPGQFLKDRTGNRRYWCVKCGPNFNSKHGLDGQLIWAQVYEQYYKKRKELFPEQKYAWHLSHEEHLALERSNSIFMEVNFVEEALLSTYEFEEEATELKNINLILEECGLQRNAHNTCKVKEILPSLSGVAAPEQRSKKGLMWPVPRRRTLTNQPGY